MTRVPALAGWTPCDGTEAGGTEYQDSGWRAEISQVLTLVEFPSLVGWSVVTQGSSGGFSSWKPKFSPQRACFSILTQVHSQPGSRDSLCTLVTGTILHFWNSGRVP